MSIRFREGRRQWKGEKEVNRPWVWDANPGSLNSVLKAKENPRRVLVFRQMGMVTENGLEGRHLNAKAGNGAKPLMRAEGERQSHGRTLGHARLDSRPTEPHRVLVWGSG